MLHPSLLELAESAPLCANPATVRGVLADSLELLGNALQHGEDPSVLAGWFSRVITDALHSPGVDDEIVLTGPVGRGDALPTSPVRWLAVVGKHAVDPNPGLARMLTDLGFVAEPVGAATRGQWEERARSGQDAAVYLDAGTWVASLVQVDARTLLDDALASRPPAIELADGLPSRDMSINVRAGLMIPTVNLARWAAYQAGSTAPTTAQRLIDARTAAVLTTDEADALTQVWKSSLELQSRRWMDHVHDQDATAWDVPALQRSTYGAAARLLSQVMSSVETRHAG